MKVKEDVQVLMDKLEKSVEGGGGTNVLRLLGDVLQLFDGLKQILPSTNAVERQEIFSILGRLHVFLQEQTHKLSRVSGLSEQQLLQFSENPDNFTKEQWGLLAEVKTKMKDEAAELKQIMRSLPGPFMPAPEAFLDQMKAMGPESAKKSPMPKKGKVKKGQIKA